MVPAASMSGDAAGLSSNISSTGADINTGLIGIISARRRFAGPGIIKWLAPARSVAEPPWSNSYHYADEAHHADAPTPAAYFFNSGPPEHDRGRPAARWEAVIMPGLMPIRVSRRNEPHKESFDWDDGHYVNFRLHIRWLAYRRHKWRAEIDKAAAP